jgi:hypothetical protein
MVLNLDHKKFAEANIVQNGGSYMKPMDFSYEDLESDLEAGSKAGFEHYELWNLKLDKYLERKTPSELKELCSSLNIDTPLYSLLPNIEDEHAFFWLMSLTLASGLILFNSTVQMEISETF